MSELTMESPAEKAAGAARAPLLVAEDVHKSFQVGDRSIEVLHGAHIELRHSERLCLMGASGAGKSTFLHILGLLEAPSSGSVEIEGQQAWSLPIKRRAELRNQKIGFVFQFYHLIGELDAVENVVLPAMIADAHGGRYKGREKAVERAVKKALADAAKEGAEEGA